jgi:hypothetical protein
MWRRGGDSNPRSHKGSRDFESRRFNQTPEPLRNRSAFTFTYTQSRKDNRAKPSAAHKGSIRRRAPPSLSKSYLGESTSTGPQHLDPRQTTTRTCAAVMRSSQAATHLLSKSTILARRHQSRKPWSNKAQMRFSFHRVPCSVRHIAAIRIANRGAIHAPNPFSDREGPEAGAGNNRPIGRFSRPAQIC